MGPTTRTFTVPVSMAAPSNATERAATAGLVLSTERHKSFVNHWEEKVKAQGAYLGLATLITDKVSELRVQARATAEFKTTHSVPMVVTTVLTIAMVCARA